MKIEFLYFQDCPAYKPAYQLLEQVLSENNISATIEKIEVTSAESAIQHRFLGSPSIRINGKDVENVSTASEYGLKCRIYRETGSGVPSESILIRALEQASSN